MRLLLDTHIWLWSLLEPQRVSAGQREALAAERSELWLSSISVWEFSLLVEKGRLSLDVDADEWLDDAFGRVGMWEAPVTHEVAREGRRVELPHRDPADRLLIATARVFDLTFVTADRRLIDAAGVRVLAG